MSKYLIEYDLHPMGKLTLGKLKAKTNNTQSNINWLEGFVKNDKCYCFYDAPNAKNLLDYVRKSDLPLTRISEVVEIIDPTKLAIIDPTK